jgi:excisionase family DNA binding protein
MAVLDLERTAALLSEDDAAALLGVSVSFLQNDRVTRRHGIPYFKVGRCVRYRQSELDAWLDSCAVGGHLNRAADK